MTRIRTMLLTAAAFAGLPLAPAAAQGSQCRPVMQSAGFDLLIGVEGVEGRFRLTCRDGTLLAVPLPATDASRGTGAQSASSGDVEAADVEEEEVTDAIDDSATEAADDLEAEAELGDVPAELQDGDVPQAAGDQVGSLPAGAQQSDTVADQIDESAAEAQAELGASELNTPPVELEADMADPSPEGGADSDAAPAANRTAAPATGSGGPGEAASPTQDGPQRTSEAAESGSETETAENAAGVAGQSPQGSISEVPMDAPKAGADGTGSMAPSADPAADQIKPGISADAAAPSGTPPAPGQAKSESRVSSGERTEMVPVPVQVVANARLALPGVEFTSVAVDGENETRIYRLAGETGAGRDVSVGVNPAGTILQVDRQILADEVPEGITRITAALLPDADIERVMLSNRDNYRTFFVFSGRDGQGQAFELEVRSDGRSVQFLRDS